jgi:cobalt/nickel transport system permease protein
MHMADALLSPAVGTTFWAGSMGLIGYCAKKLKENIDERMVPLMGVLGAFIFAAQMINFTIPATGSSGHIGGGMILAALLGPYAAFIVIASVLTIQSLFFADGGILALGCNIWNMGVYPCFIAYPLIYRTMVKTGSGPRRILTASVLSVIAGLQLGAFSVVLQTALSGRSELPFSTFVYMMLPIHLAIGLVEGFITAGVINFVRSARPEIIESVSLSRSLSQGIPIKKVITGFLIMAALAGGVMSWFASSHPDGLEWSIEKIYGKTELPEQGQGTASVLKQVQDKTAFLPGYNFKRSDEASTKQKGGQSWLYTGAGASVSGILGSIMVLGIILILGAGIKILKTRKA